MALLDLFRVKNPVLRYGLDMPAQYGSLATPFVESSHLSPAVVLNDLYDGTLEPVTRAEAMSVPAWSEARSLVCDTLSRHPLKVLAGGTIEDGTAKPASAKAERAAKFLSASKYLSPRIRMALTIDDMAHYGRSLWVVDRDDDVILDAYRVPRENWSVETTGNGLTVVVTAAGQSRYLRDREYLLFVGTEEGLLVRAADTIRGAKSLERQWISRVKNPIPLVEIRYSGDEILTTDEMRDIRTKYLDARNDPDGIVMVTPRDFQVIATSSDDVNMFIAGRNAVGLDIARFWKVRANMLDASQVNGSSVNYENVGIGRSFYYDITLRAWSMPIEERLSQDDVLPPGAYVEFDLRDLTSRDDGTGPIRED